MDDDKLVSHLESLADHIIHFENDMRTQRQKQTLPLLPVKPGQVYPNQSQWVNPALLPAITGFQDLCNNLNKAHVQHRGKAEMKIHEDPWENYLYYDSKYILPLVCHPGQLPIEEQLLLALFVRSTVEDQTISMYSLPAHLLVEQLLKFVRENHTDEDLLSRLRAAAGLPGEEPAASSEHLNGLVERTFRMFYLSMQMQGHLRAFKDDYSV